MGASQSSYDDDNEWDDDYEEETDEMPVQISSALMDKMSDYIDNKLRESGQLPPEEEENEEDEYDEEQDEDYTNDEDNSNEYSNTGNNFFGLIDNFDTMFMNGTKEEEETVEEKMAEEREETMKQNDEEIEEETSVINQVHEDIEEAENELFANDIKEKPCESEMKLFSDCLLNEDNCAEFEDSYFKCMENAK